MSRPEVHRAGFRLLGRELSTHRAAVGRIGLWSLVESLPSIALGAGDVGRHRPLLGWRRLGGLGFLGLLAAAAGVGAIATRQLFPWLAAVVEPVQDGSSLPSVEGR